MIAKSPSLIDAQRVALLVGRKLMFTLIFYFLFEICMVPTFRTDANGMTVGIFLHFSERMRPTASGYERAVYSKLVSEIWVIHVSHFRQYSRKRCLSQGLSL